MSHHQESEATSFLYTGGELETFALALHWKRYWGAMVRPYIGRRVLEIGAGLGATARLYKDLAVDHWLGLEPDADMAARLQKEAIAGDLGPAREFRAAYSSELPADARFDTILYVDVLEHIEDDQGELIRMDSHLDAKGKIIVLSPAHQFLYTPFDARIGHFRRYNKSMLRHICPSHYSIEKLCYLDSVGMFASLANRLLLKSDNPSIGQVKFWDNVMVPISRVVDPLLMRQVGKTILCVYQKN